MTRPCQDAGFCLRRWRGNAPALKWDKHLPRPAASYTPEGKQSPEGPDEIIVFRASAESTVKVGPQAHEARDAPPNALMSGGTARLLDDAVDADDTLADAGEPDHLHADAEPVQAPVLRRRVPLDDDQLGALLVRIVERESAAFESFYDATLGRVNALVQRIVRDAGLAEEVVEDVFFQVWREAPRFQPTRGRAGAWLLSMARSRAIDALRRRERHGAEMQVEDDVLAAQPDPGRSDPHDLLALARRDRRLQDALAALEPQPRQLLALAFFRGLTHEEVADETGLPLGTVKSTIRRALMALRSALGPEGAGDLVAGDLE